MSTTSLIHQFPQLLRRALRPSTVRPRSVAIAVSGGVDSMALALLASKGANAGIDPFHVHTFTVDHGLRLESAVEARKVHEQLLHLGIPNEILAIDWGVRGLPSKVQLEKEARIARYQVLGEAMTRHGCTHLFVGHHQGDVVETGLLRLARASGIYGLGGLVPLSPWPFPDHPDLLVVRPLLGISKTLLKNLCQESKIEWVEDPSNNDLTHQRNAIRQVLHEVGDHTMHVAFFNRMSQRRYAIDRQVLDFFERHVTEYPRLGAVVISLPPLPSIPRPILTRIITMTILHITGRSGGVRLKQLGKAIAALREQRAACIAGALISPSPSSSPVEWRVTRQPPSLKTLPSLTFPLTDSSSEPLSVEWGNRFRLHISPGSLSVGGVVIRPYASGDGKALLDGSKGSLSSESLRALREQLTTIGHTIGPQGLLSLPVLATPDRIINIPFLSAHGLDGWEVDMAPIHQTTQSSRLLVPPTINEMSK